MIPNISASFDYCKGAERGQKIVNIQIPPVLMKFESYVLDIQ